MKDELSHIQEQILVMDALDGDAVALDKLVRLESFLRDGPDSRQEIICRDLRDKSDEELCKEIREDEEMLKKLEAEMARVDED